MFGISNRSYEILMSTLAEFEQVEEAVIFGSRAKGNFKPGSDIDIALKGENINEGLAMQINAELNEEKPIPYFFDVVAYPAITNEKLKDHIQRVGKTLYTKISNPIQQS